MMAGSRWVLRGKESQKSGLDLSEVLDRISGFALANLLWVLLSLPILSMPAATAGLFAATSPWSRGKSGDLFRDFFDGIRQCWLKSTAIVVVDVAVGGLAVINLVIFRMMNMAQPLAIVSQSVTLCVVLLMILVNLYAWPLMVIVDLPAKQLLFTSMQLVFAHPWRTILLFLAGLVPITLGAFLPAAFMILACVSACAFLINWGVWRVIRQYIGADDLARLEADKPFPIQGQYKRTLRGM